MFALEKKDIIRDPIHRYIEITSFEKEVINSPWIQRLRYIKQTPSASYVYPGSIHTRFEHSLGVMHVGGMWIEHLLRDMYIKIDCHDERNKWIRKQIQKVRIAGLLHDVGHGPLSHSFESYFLFVINKNAEINHETIGLEIIDNELNDILMSDRGELTFDHADIEDIKAMINGDEINTDCRYLYQIIANKKSIDADKMDYLLRDAYFSGASEYGKVDAERLIMNSEIGWENNIVHHQRSYYTHQHFWLARAHMYRNIYLHRTSVAFDILFGALFLQVESEYKISEKLKDRSYYMTLTDNTFLNIYRENEKIKPIIDKLNSRDIPKIVYEEELPVEYKIHATTLNEKKNEILYEIKTDLEKNGYSNDIIDNIYFEVSFINIPITSIENIWKDESNNYVKKNPSSFLNSLSDIFVVFLRVYLWAKMNQEIKEDLRVIASQTLNRWMREKGLIKGSGKPDLNL